MSAAPETDLRDGPDLRLAGLAVAAWLAALAGLHLAAPVSATLAAVAAGLATLLGLHLGGRLGRPSASVRRYGWTAVAVLLGVVCGATATAARVAVRDAAPVRALVHERALVTAELVVRDDPRPIRGAAGRPSTVLVRADLVSLTDGTGRRVAGRVRGLVLASDPAWRALLPGQRATVRGRLQAPRGGDLTAAVLSATGSPALHGPPPWVQRAAGALRAGLQRACEPLPDEPGGLLPGLVVGDTSRLPPAVEEDFRTTGMTHLNAVSGSNVAIVVGAVLLLARLLTTHGATRAPGLVLRATAVGEAAVLAAVFTARLPGCGFLATPVDLLVDALGPGSVPALLCGASALTLLIHATRTLTRASAHARADHPR